MLDILPSSADSGSCSLSAHVKIFSIVAINAMKESVLSHDKSVLNHKWSVLRRLVNVFFLFHVLCVLPVPHVLPTYSMFFHPGCQDGTIRGALRSTCEVMSLMVKILTIQCFRRLTFPIMTLVHNAGKLDVYPNELATGNDIP